MFSDIKSIFFFNISRYKKLKKGSIALKLKIISILFGHPPISSVDLIQ